MFLSTSSPASSNVKGGSRTEANTGCETSAARPRRRTEPHGGVEAVNEQTARWRWQPGDEAVAGV
jgi:hypothetical protein